MKLRNHRFLLGAAILLPAAYPVSSASAAEDTGQSATVYASDFFARVQPTNAYDMVTQLPGFRLIEGDAEVRGYSGAAGNILIDGQRPAGKAETLETLLKRIPAARVARIELIRAGRAGYDMQGYALLANVILASGGKIGGRIEGEYAVYRHGYRAPRGSAQIELDRNGRVITLFGAAYREIDDEHGFGTRNRFAEDGTPIRLSSYFQPEGTDVLEGTIAYRTPLLGGTLRLNGLIQDKRMFADIGYDIVVPAPETIRGSERNHTRTYEAGLRYERPLGAASDFELIGNYRSVAKLGIDRETTASGSDRSDESSDSSESILRAAFRHRTGSLALEVGAEGAINILDSSNLLFEDDVAVPLPNSNVRVEEHRAEFFTNATWTLNSRLTAETGLRFETSRLAQSGDTDLSKSLAFWKPRARLNWSLSKSDQLRFLIEREVGQLDFEDFVGAASLNSGTISAGNQDLEPDSRWRAEATYEHRFGSGSLVFSARREWISDLVDQLPIVSNGEIYDAVGNIGSARQDEIEAAIKWPLDDLGLKGVILTGDIVARRSRATDPSTGERRRISGEGPVEGKIALSHDIPAWKLRWGGTLVLAETETSYKVREIEADRLGARLDLFVEYKPDANWTFRLFGRNLTDSPATRTREIYTGVRGASPFRYSEIRTLRSGPYVGLTIQRNFGV